MWESYLILKFFCGFAKNRSAQLRLTLVCMYVCLFVCWLVISWVLSVCQILVCGFSLWIAAEYMWDIVCFSGRCGTPCDFVGQGRRVSKQWRHCGRAFSVNSCHFSVRRVKVLEVRLCLGMWHTFVLTHSISCFIHCYGARVVRVIWKYVRMR